MRWNPAHRVVSAIALIGAILHASPSPAQVQTSITSSGLGTTVAPPPASGTTYAITGGTRPGNGPNLFHSFGSFNVGEGDTASFRNTTPGLSTSNILSRVSGGEPSNIFGTIDTLSYPGANLYLLNPAGVIFGRNARLEVGGSFHASAADYLRFADRAKFYANLSQNSVLTIARPEAFGFLGVTPPARLTVQGSSLQVPNGQTLSLVGGEVAITGAKLAAPGGRVQIASLSSGEVTLDGGVTPSSRLGPIKITGGSVIGATGLSSGLGSGTVIIRGGQLLVDASTILADHTPGDVAGPRLIDIQVTGDVVLTNGAKISSTTSVAERGGDVTITADRLQLNNQSRLETNALAEGDGGDVTTTVGRLDVAGGSIIGSTTKSTGHGGSITIKADAITISGFGSTILSDAEADGNGGKVSIGPRSSTLDLVLEDAGAIKSTTGLGAGSGGDIEINATNVSLLGGAMISSLTSSTAPSPAPGGNITIKADAITISGFGSTILSDAEADGNGGKVSIGPRSSTSTLDLVLDDTGIISSATGFFSGGGNGAGIGGAIEINATNVSLLGGAAVTSQTFTPARGGDITIKADAIKISGRDSAGNPSQILSDAEADGNGGKVSISPRSSTSTLDLVLRDVGTIQSTTDFGVGIGGAIEINATNVSLLGGATIGSLTSSPAASGSITLKANTVTISGNDSLNPESPSGIVSTTFGTFNLTGPPGKISVTATTFTLTQGGVIQSGGQFDSVAGDIEVTATNSLVISNRGSISSQAFAGPGGQVLLGASTATAIMDGGFVNTSTIGAGRAGNILIDVGTLTMSNGARVASSSEENSPAPGGSVMVIARDSVAISGTSTGLFSTTASPDKGGSAGTVVVTAPTLTIADRGKISVESTGVAPAGDISLTLGTLTLSGGAGLFSNATSSGPGGNINVQAGQIQLSGGATISAKSSGPAVAGNVTIAATTFQTQDSFVTTAATQADGGDIDILVGSLVYLTGSEITTSVGKGAGKGGNITIDPQFVVLNDSQIRADAFGGPGGNITIVTDVFLSSGSIVSASSALSAPGTINIAARITNLSDSLVQLPDNVLQAATLLRAACTARVAEGKASSLVVAGREGVPPEPEGLLWSPLGATLTDFGVTAGEVHQRELLPRFSGVWLDSNCAR